MARKRTRGGGADEDLRDPDAAADLVETASQRIRELLGDGAAHFEIELVLALLRVIPSQQLYRATPYPKQTPDERGLDAQLTRGARAIAAVALQALLSTGAIVAVTRDGRPAYRRTPPPAAPATPTGPRLRSRRGAASVMAKKKKPQPAPPAMPTPNPKARIVQTEIFQRAFEESLLRPLDVYDPDTGWRDEAEVDEINKERAFLADVLGEERRARRTLEPDAERGRKFPVGATKGHRAWQQAVTTFAATRPRASVAELLRALETGAVPAMVLIPNDDGDACADVDRDCAVESHFHYKADTVSRDQVLRHLRFVRPKPSAPRP